MKFLKFLSLFLLVAFLVGCQNDETGNEEIYPENGNLETVETENVNDETTDVQTEEYPIEESTDLEPIPHVIGNHRYVNQLLLVDVVTGEEMANYEFGEYDSIEQIWDLCEGYFVVWVGYEDLWWRSLRLGEEEAFDNRTQSERNFRFVIFDEYLNYVETLLFNEEEFDIGLWGSVLRIVEGELFVYGWEVSFEQTADLLRINAHTRVVERLFSSYIVNLHAFIDDNQILFSRFSTPDPGSPLADTYTAYGILNLENEEISLFKIEDYVYDRLIIDDLQVLITERGDLGATFELTNQVTVFDLENRTSEAIQLNDEDSTAAFFSYDGDHIVTININESVFRKYDFAGRVVAEVDIELPDYFVHHNIRIFPITENSYSMLLQTPVFRDDPSSNGRHIQMITLP